MSDATEEILETIDKYLGGNMETAERLLFEQEITQNASLKSLIDASKSVQELLVDHKTAEFKAKFSSLLQQEKTKKRWRYSGLSIATGIGLLGGIWIYQSAGEQNIHTVSQKQKGFIESIPTNPPQKTPSTPSSAHSLTMTKEQKPRISTSVNTIEDTNTQKPSIESQKEEASIKEQHREETRATSEKTIPSNNPPQIFDCSSTMITFTPRSTATCKGQSEGSISISGTTTGGKAPYHWHIDGVQKSPQETVEHLAAGDYWIVMNDQNGCSTKTMVTIATKNCIEAHEYSLDPYAGNKLSWGQTDKVITLSIYHKNGKLAYKQNFESGDTLEWEGRDMEGNVLANGVYLYSITNGSELQEKGYVTIINSH